VSDPVIEIADLTRRFGTKDALSSVTLTFPRGGVYGLVGANGAGKTTLIKHVMGLLKAERGSVRIFGLDPVAAPVGVLSHIGYLSEENDLPGWMTVGELIRYTRAFYPKWDDAYAEELRKRFALDAGQKIKNLSKGQKARAGLLIALAHRPQLLVLDEPSSGLDPIVRKDAPCPSSASRPSRPRIAPRPGSSGGATDALSRRWSPASYQSSSCCSSSPATTRRPSS
jgi:ABC-2 type transport system ATP-binding protein